MFTLQTSATIETCRMVGQYFADSQLDTADGSTLTARASALWLSPAFSRQYLIRAPTSSLSTLSTLSDSKTDVKS